MKTFLKTDHAYRVVVPFAGMDVGHVIQIVSISRCSDPRTAGGGGLLALQCVEGEIVLDCIHDKNIVNNIADYLNEVGPIDHDQAFTEFKKNFLSRNRQAEADTAAWNELMKEEIFRRLNVERKKYPSMSDKDLVYRILKQLRKEGL
jgi:hypothetical protein